MMKYLSLVLLAGLILWTAPARAQVHQSGVVTTNDCAKWAGNGLIADSGGACPSTVITSITAGLGLATATGTCASGSITSVGTISACVTSSDKTTSYSLLNTDGSKVIRFNGSSITATIEQATASGNYANGWSTLLENINSTALTIALDAGVTSTLKGCPAPPFTIPAGWQVGLASDGTNYSCAISVAPPTINTQTGTSYTLTAGDCFNLVRTTSASAVAITIPATLIPSCVITVEQAGAGQITFAAGGSGALHSAHSYTKTYGQWAIVTLTVESGTGTNAVVILSGDGA